MVIVTVSDTSQELIYSKILNFLSIKDRSEYEVRQRIKQHLLKSSISRDEKVSIEDDVVKILYGLNLLDDSQYAKKFVSQKITGNKAASKLSVYRFLIKKGIDKEVISDVLKEYSSSIELEKAIQAAKNKLSVLRESDKAKRKAKLFRYLASKGFSVSIIYSVIDSIDQLK